jgi:hypothetical protein
VIVGTIDVGNVIACGATDDFDDRAGAPSDIIIKTKTVTINLRRLALLLSVICRQFNGRIYIL